MIMRPSAAFLSQEICIKTIYCGMMYGKVLGVQTPGSISFALLQKKL